MENLSDALIQDPAVQLPEAERPWYLLWAPAGFGGTTSRIVDILEIVREFDPQGIVWYPLYPITIGHRSYMKAMYAGYMFVKCNWSAGLEDTLVERLPCHTLFVKDMETTLPIPIVKGDIQEVEKVAAEIMKKPTEFFPITHLKVGTEVKILKRAFAGQCGKVAAFLPKNKISVELEMFGRAVPVSLEFRDVEVL